MAIYKKTLESLMRLTEFETLDNSLEKISLCSVLLQVIYEMCGHVKMGGVGCVRENDCFCGIKYV